MSVTIIDVKIKDKTYKDVECFTINTLAGGGKVIDISYNDERKDIFKIIEEDLNINIKAKDL